MAQVKEKLITGMARFLYERLLAEPSFAVPHDNDIQNKLWADPYLQQKVVRPLRHHMTDNEIIRKFNEVFNAVAEDVKKRHGETLYSLQNTDDDSYYNSGAGFVEDEEEPVESWMPGPAEPLDESPFFASDNLTKKEQKYLNEMVLVFNDDACAVQKTYKHFKNYGVSRELQRLYTESLTDLFQGSDPNSFTKREEEAIEKSMEEGHTRAQALYAAYRQFAPDCSQALKDAVKDNEDKEACEESEEEPYEMLPIPGWALCYFVNGDEDGLSEEDLELIHEFEKEYRVEAPDSDDEGYFSWVPAFGRACVVYDCPCYPRGDSEDNEELFDGPPSYGFY